MLKIISKNTFFVLTILLNYMIPSSAYSSRQISHLNVDSYTKENSSNDSLYSSQIIFSSDRRNIFWPYSFARQNAIDVGIRYKNNSGLYEKKEITGNSFSLTLGNKINNNFYFLFSPSFHTYTYLNTTHKTYNYNSSFNYTKNNHQLSLYYLSDFEYESLLFLEDRSSPLKSHSVETIYRLKNNNFLYSISSKLKQYSDNNISSKSSVEILYSSYYMNTEYSFGLGTTYEKSKFKDSTYSSPYSSFSYGPQIEINKKVLSFLTLYGSASLERTSDYIGNKSFDFWGSISTSFFERDTHNFTLAYENSSSFSEEKWYENKLKININLFM